MTDEPMAFEPPQDWFGSRYEIIRPLKQGAMGRVYLARQTDIDRRVVVKALPTQFSMDEKLSERFKIEMKVMSVLEHPNTIRLYDFGTTSTGEFFIVMEFVDGVDVQTEVVDNGRMHPNRVIRLGLQVARALHAAHSEGVIHRDLKPENIMIRDLYGEKDVVKVLDFGIAKYEPKGESSSGADSGRKPRLTTKGMVVGTPQYISPEQATAEPLDRRTDIYSLGCVLYFAAVGTAPFDDSNIMAVLYAHINTTPPSPAEVAGVPHQLSELIMRCMEKVPQKRYQTAAEVAQALLAVDLAAGKTPARVPTPKPAGPPAAAHGEAPTVGVAAAAPAPTPTPVSAAPGVGAGQAGLSNLQKDLRPDGAVSSYAVGVEGMGGESSRVRPDGAVARSSPMHPRHGNAGLSSKRPAFQTAPKKSNTALVAIVALLLLAGGGVAAYFLVFADAEGTGGSGAAPNKKLPQAVQPLAERCEAGNSAACLDAARLYRFGEKGVPVDDVAAKRFYDVAVKDFKKKCKGGAAYFCYSLGNMYSEDGAVPLDLTKSSAYYKKACDMGYEDACALK